jgi:hypothetical protein
LSLGTVASAFTSNTDIIPLSNAAACAGPAVDSVSSSSSSISNSSISAVGGLAADDSSFSGGAPNTEVPKPIGADPG